MQTKTYLLASLTRLWSLEPKLVHELQAAIERASQQDLEKIVAVIEKGIAKQDVVLKKLVKNDPELPKKLRAFLHDKFQGVRGEVQTGEQQNLEKILEQFESS